MSEVVIPHFPVDLTGLEDIKEALHLSDEVGVNLNCMPEELNPDRFLNGDELFAPGTEVRLYLKRVLEHVGVTRYEIITDNKKRFREDLKKQGVVYVGSVNDFGDLNLESIDDIPFTLTKYIMGGRYTNGYVLFYKEYPRKHIFDNFKKQFFVAYKMIKKVLSIE